MTQGKLKPSGPNEIGIKGTLKIAMTLKSSLFVRQQGRHSTVTTLHFMDRAEVLVSCQTSFPQ